MSRCQNCICCVCVLREQPEFAAVFTAADECCEGCHSDMAAPGWPENHCGDAALDGAS